MLTRRETLKSMLAAAGALRAPKPNFIILLSDDLGYGDVRCFGAPNVPTPHIDGIAARGVRFTDGYVTCPVCSPSRAAIMTGRYQQRFGHEFNPPVSYAREAQENLGLPLSEITLPQLLKKAGYATGAVGKWHLGTNPPFHPLARGFDEYFGFLGGGTTYLTEETPQPVSAKGLTSPVYPVGPRNAPWPPIMHGRQTVTENEYLTDAFGREAVSFIERHKQEPFFLYLAFNAIHEPFQSTLRYVDRVAHIPNERQRVLAAMTLALDDNIGKVLGKLRENGLENDTMVFFLSDNGAPTYSGAGSNGPLSGSKCTMFEGGIRLPFCMQWQGHVPGRQVYRHPIMSFDLLATFVSQAGVALPTDRTYDGADLVPHLTGKAGGAPHEMLFWRAGRNSAARQGNWKLLQLGEDRTRLYDLSTDISEKKDLSASQPRVVKAMRAALKEWNSQMRAPLWASQHASPHLPVNGEDIIWDV
jgi:arylsulfatase A-like enzyme